MVMIVLVLTMVNVITEMIDPDCGDEDVLTVI